MLMANKKPQNQQSGFTIIELLIATTVFSTILLVASAGIISVGRSYYKGIIQSRTQEVTRSITEDISRSLQLGGNTKVLANVATAADPVVRFCVGNVRYRGYLNSQVTGAARGLTAQRIDQSSNCNITTPTPEPEIELLRENMRLLKLNVVGVTNDTWRVEIRVAYGDNVVLDNYNDNGTPKSSDPTNPINTEANCSSGLNASAFCATSELDTVVQKRLN
jgi:prepilin-type N-terminal cleavage/methylation domain-containing protein